MPVCIECGECMPSNANGDNYSIKELEGLPCTLKSLFYCSGCGDKSYELLEGSLDPVLDEDERDAKINSLASDAGNKYATLKLTPEIHKSLFAKAQANLRSARSDYKCLAAYKNQMKKWAKERQKARSIMLWDASRQAAKERKEQRKQEAAAKKEKKKVDS